jgi:UDP-glucose-4-epimerase GalE
MRVLVTGGAGYIGSHAVRELADEGHEVTIFDNFSTGHRSLVSGFNAVEGDVGDFFALRRALSGMEVVMHFAACAYVGESVSNPRKYFENNVANPLALLNAAIDSGIRNFIFSSSCAVYGIPESLPVTEDTPCRPANPYGETKRIIERALEAYERAYGLRSVRLRYFNAAGAHPRCATGELHEPETHLIPLALEAAAGLRSHLEIFGDNYDTPDGTCIRDYTHVVDLAAAHVRALEYLDDGGESCSVNLGTGKGHSVAEVVSAVEQVTTCKVKTIIRERRSGDPPVLVADASKAKRLLGWTAECSLDRMVASAWQWMHSERYRSLKELELRTAAD